MDGTRATIAEALTHGFAVADHILKGINDKPLSLVTEKLLNDIQDMIRIPVEEIPNIEEQLKRDTKSFPSPWKKLLLFLCLDIIKKERMTYQKDIVRVNLMIDLLLKLTTCLGELEE